MVLPEHFLLRKPFYEHHQYFVGEVLSDDILTDPLLPIYFKNHVNNEDFCCFKIDKMRKPCSSYFIGVDWLVKDKCAIYIEPKLNKSGLQTDYLSMLFSALKHPDILEHTEDLFEIKWEVHPIEINQTQDLLTPLLIVQFLKVVQRIVRKGLKKSYYKVEHNLYGKVKGKILVASTIKHNHFKNKPLNTFCSFDEFGLNGFENRLLKKALVFVQRYLCSHPKLNGQSFLTQTFAYINPAFEGISEEVSLHDVKHIKTNAFYKEYEEGIRLAKLILKKFGYNIVNTETLQKIKTPPFWIDMSKLFELYVLGQLKEKYGNNILYGSKEASGKYGLPDFLLTKENEQTIIDAKYKSYYKNPSNHKIIDDVRQLSGYARDKGVLNKLGFSDENDLKTKIVKCLIIYPDLTSDLELFLNDENRIDDFVEFYKRPVALPLVKLDRAII